MRLIRLSANRETFKTIHFNPTGLTFIVGSQSKEGETYNGVGKSLVIALLHFCLGSSKNDAFSSKIPNWEFTLDFDLLGEKHVVSRSTSNQSVCLLDHLEIKLNDFNKWMEERLFSIPDGIQKLSFRTLLPKFLRRGNKEYADPRETSDRTDYEMLIRNAFLLGMDVHLITKKAELREEATRIQALRKNFKNDPLLRDFYSGGKDAEIHLSHLESQIKKLAGEIEQFTIAENYYALQKTADDLAIDISNEKNSVFLIKNAIENIDKSIKDQPDLPLKRLQSLYGELACTFKPESLKRLEEVSVFQTRLLENRIARLSREKLHLMDQQRAKEDDLKKKQLELDKQLKILGQSRALDQYTAMVNHIADLRAQVGKLKDYQSIEREYSNREANIKGQLSDEIIKTNAYLEDTREFREKNTGIFKEYAALFYPSKVAGISIHNNDGVNQKRFDFDVHIENDSSDGINEVRIFCYDLALLTLKQGHKVDFVFHDSRLYANMDVRQRATLFRLAHEVTKAQGLQYIATLNPDQISGMEQELTPEELKEIITDNIVLELKDHAASGKLLGIQVDMHYH